MAAGCGTGSAWADWADDFDGTTFDQTWSSTSSPSGGTFSVVDVGATTDDHLAVAGAPGIGFGVGWVASDTFGDVLVSGWVNEAGTGTGTTDFTDHFMLARLGFGLGIDAYALQVDWEASGISLNVAKLAASSAVGGASDSNFYLGTTDNNQRYWAELIVEGAITPVVTGKLFDAPGGTLVASATFTDTTSVYTSGFVGLAAAADSAGGYTGTFDDISASSTIPEPGMVVLTLCGVAPMLLGRRRRAVA